MSRDPGPARAAPAHTHDRMGGTRRAQSRPVARHDLDRERDAEDRAKSRGEPATAITNYGIGGSIRDPHQIVTSRRNSRRRASAYSIASREARHYADISGCARAVTGRHDVAAGDVVAEENRCSGLQGPPTLVDGSPGKETSALATPDA